MSGRVRVTGGRFGGRTLAVGGRVRPTEGRVREALFSIWQNRLPGAVVLDLFAGSGVVALEALGRGADRVVLVEGEPRIARSLRSALASMASKREAIVLCGRLPAALETLAAKNPDGFDLIFADPPYAFEDHEGLAERAACLLHDDGQLVVEHSSRRPLDPGRLQRLEIVDERDYGESRLTFLRLRSSDEADGGRDPSAVDRA